MKKNDYSKCPKCHQQIYIYVSRSDDENRCYKATSDLEVGDEVEIAMGSRWDRADYVEDETYYTCDLSMAQGVLDNFKSNACEKINCISKQEMIWTIDYYSIYDRKEIADKKYSKREQEETSVPVDWVRQNIDSEMLKNESFALWALAIDGILLEHFSKEIKSNIEIVCVAIGNSAKACLYIDESLLKKKKNIFTLLNYQGQLLDNVRINPAWLNEKEFIKEIIENAAGIGRLEFSKEIWNDLDFIRECVKKNGNIITLDKFPEELFNDNELVANALNSAFEIEEMEVLVKALPNNLRSNLNFWQGIIDKVSDYNRRLLSEFLPDELKKPK